MGIECFPASAQQRAIVTRTRTITLLWNLQWRKIASRFEEEEKFDKVAFEQVLEQFSLGSVEMVGAE